ncbi:MAG: TetR/AcrR family transcriptional regulator [Actinomycetota bacterium]
MRSVDEDLTTRARIRQAAIERLPREGVGGTTIRAVAADAGVSPALVLHHFGSKKRLIRSCDEYVVDTIRTVKGGAIEDGTLSDPSLMAASFQLAPPILRYLGWSLARGTEAAADLFDEMVEESVRLFGMMEERGMVRPTDNPRERSAVFLTMQMGALILHDHLERSIGLDIFQTEGVIALSRRSMEILGGLFTESTINEMTAALQQAGKDLEEGERDG